MLSSAQVLTQELTPEDEYDIYEGAEQQRVPYKLEVPSQY